MAESDSPSLNARVSDSVGPEVAAHHPLADPDALQTRAPDARRSSSASHSVPAPRFFSSSSIPSSSLICLFATLIGPQAMLPGGGFDPATATDDTMPIGRLEDAFAKVFAPEHEGGCPALERGEVVES